MWPFRSKKSPPLPNLIFNSGQDFFDYHCAYMDTKIEAEKPLVAIVLDAEKQFGAESSVKRNERGLQIAALCVASSDGGFVTFSETLSDKGEPLMPGDVVAWIPSVFHLESAKTFGCQDSGWIGLIVAKIAPEIDVVSGQMKLICRY